MGEYACVGVCTCVSVCALVCVYMCVMCMCAQDSRVSMKGPSPNTHPYPHPYMHIYTHTRTQAHTHRSQPILHPRAADVPPACTADHSHLPMDSPSWVPKAHAFLCFPQPPRFLWQREGEEARLDSSPPLVPLPCAQPAVGRQQQARAGTGQGPWDTVAGTWVPASRGVLTNSKSSPSSCQVARVVR